MANKLTKYKSATTIFTADAANAIYGGLSGSSESDSLAPDDPRVIGHAHDGQNLDGHAQKINLEDHVTAQLRHINLGDEAVTKRNVTAFTDPSLAIPISEIRGSDTFYYIDINTLPEQGAFKTDPPVFSTEISSPEVTSNSPGDLTSDDFVFGSDSIDDDGDAAHDSRLFFDKSKSAFRAGSVASTAWDDISRGSHSVGFGQDTTVSGAHSSVLGGRDNTTDSDFTTILGGGGSGVGNSIANASQRSSVLGGSNNAIGATTTATWSVVGGGENNQLDGSIHSVIAGGGSSTAGNRNRIAATTSGSANVISGGQTNVIQGGIVIANSIAGGSGGNIGADSEILLFNTIGGGVTNSITTGTGSVITGGNSGVVENSDYSFVGGGGLGGTSNGNEIHDSNYSVIVGGSSNDILGSGSDGNNFIGGGLSNVIAEVVESIGGTIVGGNSNSIADGSFNFIGGGDNNIITAGSDNVITGGDTNQIVSGGQSVIGGGASNMISTQYAGIAGGKELVIEEEAIYGFSSGYFAASRALGEMSNASNDILDGMAGSSQQTTVVFSREVAMGKTTDFMYLDGSAQQSYIKNNSLIYVTLELVITNKTGTSISGARRRSLIRCNGTGGVSFDNSAVSDVIDPTAPVATWGFQPDVNAGNHWRIELTPPGGEATSEDWLAVCVVTGSQVIYAS